MLQKFKITTCAFILCLFGLTLIGVSHVSAADEEFGNCQALVKQGHLAKASICFKELRTIDREGLEQWIVDVISRMESELETKERWAVCVRASG